MSAIEIHHTLGLLWTVVVAAVLGGVIGLERERLGKSAGVRTHMLVSLGSAVFVMVAVEIGAREGDVSRVVQGVATGIGFIGAGTILKRTDREEIQGLTSAAAIWLTSAIGVAVGAGQALMAAVTVLGGWGVLVLVALVTRRFEQNGG